MANFLDVSWAVEVGKGFTISVYYVDKLSAGDLMKRLKDRGTRLADYTRALIKEKLNDKDSDVMTTSCKVTLACPLGERKSKFEPIFEIKEASPPILKDKADRLT